MRVFESPAPGESLRAGSFTMLLLVLEPAALRSQMNAYALNEINPKTIDEYLAQAKPEQRAALEKLRQTIRAVAPKAEECISYGLPAFRLNGRPLVAFGASTSHCSFFPMNGTTVAAFRDQLKGFETSKGTIRFTPDKPLPVALIRKLVKARIAENTTSSKVS